MSQDIDEEDTLHVLIYDGDCAVCTRLATWAAARGNVPIAPWQSLDLEPLHLTEEDVRAAAWWVDGAGRQFRGERAVAKAMVARGGWTVPFGVLLDLPGVRHLARPVYRFVARNRHRMPGATAACDIEDPDELAG